MRRMGAVMAHFPDRRWLMALHRAGREGERERELGCPLWAVDGLGRERLFFVWFSRNDRPPREAPSLAQ